MANLDQITVIGAGLMGHGIAQTFAGHGFPVKLYDINQEVLDRATDKIRENLKLCIQTGFETEASAAALVTRISATMVLRDAVAGSRFVVEAAPENLALKKSLFEQVAETAADDTIIASNTSTLSIDDISDAIKNQARFIQTHWFNPPHLIPVVEVVKGAKTSQAVFEKTMALLKQAGKEPVHVLKAVPGLVVNRIQTAVFREIIGLIEAGIINPEEVERAVTGSMGIRLAALGPLTTVDLAGVDLWYLGAKALYPLFDASQKPQKFLEDMMKSGHEGAKSGQGFFNYPPGKENDLVKQRDIRLLKLAHLLYQSSE